MIMEDQKVSDQFEAFPRFGLGLGDAAATASELGGKGANLSKMAAKGYPVPPGFTIGTVFCGAYQKMATQTLDAIMQDIPAYTGWLKDSFGYMPLLSVRSGAPVSMPGMMDTILNVGLTAANIKEWKSRIGPRAAYDSYRRLLSMLGTTALGMDQKHFDAAFSAAKGAVGATTDQDMDEEALRDACKRYYTVYKAYNTEVPDTLDKQLRVAIGAVFKSWNSDRAIFYRQQEGIPGDIGTAVTVQTMVFGNFNDDSGSGVLFTRNPATGENVIMGEYLMNAQGEDVVAGIRTPENLLLDKDGYGETDGWQDELRNYAVNLEGDAQDMQDIEFTIQDGRLWILQTRNGKRTAKAAFRIAMDLLDEGIIPQSEIYNRVQAKHYVMASRPVIDPKFKDAPWLIGIPASPGVVTGKVVVSSLQAIASEEPCILVTEETTPDDIAGMAAAVGILTRTGGATSHAAVVARGMNKPCVVGATELCSTTDFEVGDTISIDGATGRVWKGAVPVIDSSNDPYVERFFKMLYQDHGLIERTMTPVAKGCLTMADWCGRTAEEISAMLDILAVLDTEDDKVVLDVSPPDSFGCGVDKFMWGIGGAIPEQDIYWDRVITPLAQRGFSHHRFVSNNPTISKRLESSGLQPIPTVTTVKEVVETRGQVILTPELESALGSNVASREEMIKFLSAAGAKGTVFKRPMLRGEAAFAVLKGV